MPVNQLETVVTPNPDTGESTSQAQAQQAQESALQKKYGGDWTKANDGYFNLNSKFGEVQQSANQLTARNQQLEQVLGVLLGGQPAQVDPMTALANELGLTSPEPARASIRSEVEQVLQNMFGPLVKSVQAEETLAEEIDNFEQLRGEARRYMKTDSEVAETFKAVQASNPERAWKYAIREMLISKGGQPQPNPQPSTGLPFGAPRQQVGQQPIGQQTSPQEQATREAESLKYFQDYGDASAYRANRFAGTSIERAVQAALRQQLGYGNDWGG